MVFSERSDMYYQFLTAPHETVEIIPSDGCVCGLGELDEGHIFLAMKYFDSIYVTVKAEKVEKLKNN